MAETPTPPDGGGPPESIPGLETAMRQLNRIREMLQKQAQNAGDAVGGAFEGVQNAVRNLGGAGAEQAPGIVTDPETVSHVADAIAHAPEVLM